MIELDGMLELELSVGVEDPEYERMGEQLGEPDAEWLPITDHDEEIVSMIEPVGVL